MNDNLKVLVPVLPNGIIVGTAVAKINGSLGVFLAVTTKNNVKKSDCIHSIGL